MEPEEAPRDRAPRAGTIRRRAVVVLVLFVALSGLMHFTLGPWLTKMSPHWADSDLREQAISIVTLSHRDQLERMPKPTPTPTPPPLPLPRTKRDLAFLKHLEMGQEQRFRPDIRPPARRVSTLVVKRPPRALLKSRDADVVAAQAEPTPQAAQAAGASRVDTGAKQDDLAGSVVWGDDNPARVLKRAPLGIDDRAAAAARVQVEVGPDGRALSVLLVQSSGDATVDRAALDAASASTYAPATLNGMPVHGTCVVEFSPGARTT